MIETTQRRSVATRLGKLSGIVLGGLMLSANIAVAETLPFELKITGERFDVARDMQLSDVDGENTEVGFTFENSDGETYQFDLKHVPLPSNRSYPGNLDITLLDAEGKKLGYLFFAINGVATLKDMGQFGLIINVDGKPVDVQFNFAEQKPGDLVVKDLEDERFVQDTLVNKFGFQMIRPVVIPLTGEGVRSQTYKLDNHPFNVNYTLRDIAPGIVQFQYNLNSTEGDEETLLERIYFNAGSLQTLRQGMFAGKYFHDEAGTFKLVFYPTQGQTAPPIN